MGASDKKTNNACPDNVFLMVVGTLANAAHINHDRKGQVALLPYYTVNNNFISNFTVTNTTAMFKAVRVRIVDSRTAADLLNINLYLSPFDVWNATLRKEPITQAECDTVSELLTI